MKEPSPTGVYALQIGSYSNLTEAFNKDAIEAADNKAYEDLKAAGVDITTLEDPEKWSGAMDSVYEKHGSNFLDLIEEVKAVK